MAASTLISPRNGLDPALPTVPAARRGPALHASASYVICTNPRSGSWLLSEGLAATGAAGHPREWFNVLEEQRQRARWGGQGQADTSPLSYLSYVVAQGSTPNGVFGLKLHYYQLADLSAQLGHVDGCRGLPVDEAISTAFPGVRYIWLTRQDKARQAISYHRACQTDVWWQIEPGAKAEPDGSPREARPEPRFDPAAIAALERLAVANDAKWRSFFDRCGADPLVITYEDLAADYAGTIGRILGWLGVAEPASARIRPPRLRRQADELSEAWLARYTAFKAQPAPAGDATAPDGGAPAPDFRPNDPVDSVVPAAEPGSPVFALTRTPAGELPAAWRQWLAQALLQDVPRASVVETMTQHGFHADLVRAELDAALAHPYLLAGRESRAHLARGVRVLGALAELARLQPWATTVPRQDRPSRATFCESYYAANRPVVLTGLMEDWPALTRWTPGYLRSALGDEEVEIMAGRDGDPAYEVNAGQHRRPVRFGDFVDMVYGGGPSNDCYLVANNQFFERERTRILLEDFAPFGEYLDPAQLQGRCFFWFGPAGTVTPLHHDQCNILIAQVSGHKRVKLIPSTQWEHVYSGSDCVSDINCERPDFVRRPGFCRATVLDVTISPGEVLFIPVGWSHHVRALDPSISISFTNFVFPNNYRWQGAPQ
jgi:LPS sulfotransferase NodH